MTQNTATYLNILQNVIVDFNGNIITSENTLFALEIGSKIKDFHPIFLSILDNSPHANNQTSIYRGVYFSIDNHNIYCDLTVTYELGFVSITIFNYTSNYATKQSEAQKLNEQKIILSNRKTKKHPSLL